MIFLCLLHFRFFPVSNGYVPPFQRGYLGVEFFAIIGGFFLMENVHRTAEKSAMDTRFGIMHTHSDSLYLAYEYLKSRYKRLFLHHAIFFISVLLVKGLILKKITFETILRTGLLELFFGHVVGVHTALINGMMWYASAYLVSSFVICYIINRNEYFFLHVFVPFSTMFVLVGFFNHFGFLDLTEATTTWFFIDGFWRLLAEMGIGCIIYQLYKKLLPYKGRHRLLSTCFETISLVIIISLIAQRKRDWYDFLALFLIALFVLSVMAGDSYLTGILNGKVSEYLGSITYSMYCAQCVVMAVCFDILPRNYYWLSTVTGLLLIVLIAAFENMIVLKLQK